MNAVPSFWPWSSQTHSLEGEPDRSLSRSQPVWAGQLVTANARLRVRLYAVYAWRTPGAMPERNTRRGVTFQPALTLGSFLYVNDTENGSDRGPMSNSTTETLRLEVAAESAGFDHILTVPCSILRQWYSPSAGESLLPTIYLSREEEGVGLAVGLLAAGRRPLLLIQTPA